MSKNYFDLTKRKIDELKTAKQDNLSCTIVDSNGEVFNGFILTITQKTEDKIFSLFRRLKTPIKNADFCQILAIKKLTLLI